MGASGLALPLSALTVDPSRREDVLLSAARGGSHVSDNKRQFRIGGEVVLRKQAPDGKTLELTLDCDEAAQLLGDRHPVVLEARAFSREARQRELARLEGEVARLRESLRG
jgi:hypothetical protein